MLPCGFLHWMLLLGLISFANHPRHQLEINLITNILSWTIGQLWIHHKILMSTGLFPISIKVVMGFVQLVFWFKCGCVIVLLNIHTHTHTFMKVNRVTNRPPFLNFREQRSLTSKLLGQMVDLSFLFNFYCLILC